MKRLALACFFAVTAVACAKDPTSGKTHAVVGEAHAETQLPASAEVLRLTPAVAKVGFIGAKVTGQHVGRFSELGGAIALIDGKPETSRVEVEVQTASVSIEGGPAKLENHLKSADFFDVAGFPTARFVSTEIRPGSDVAGATHTVTGNLQLRGTTRSVTFPATIAVGADAVNVKAEFGINRKDFGIVYPGMSDDLIKDNVLLRIEIAAPRTAPKS
jgi:polyisoprenoid-binding protein YceI